MNQTNNFQDKYNEYKIRHYRIIELINKELLDQQKYIYNSTPYLNKLFYNDFMNHFMYINEYGYLIPFLGETKTITDKKCPGLSNQQGYDIYAYTKEGSTMEGDPLCSVYGKNIRDKKTNDLAWVDIQGYKHEYTQEVWSERDLSCKTSPIPLLHKQYSNIPNAETKMSNQNVCLTKDINSALIYELRAVNNEFIQFLKTLKYNKRIQGLIKEIQKQNLSIVQQMNQDESIDAMLNDSRVKLHMSEYQALTWSIIVVLGIGLISHFGKK